MSRVSRRRGAAIAIFIGVALAWLAIHAFSSGYHVGKDIALRENTTTAGAP